jgi:DNA-binding GntR family transcriptional regulator
LIKEHTEICDAIARRDPVAAMELAQKHIKNQEETIIRSVKKSQLVK